MHLQVLKKQVEKFIHTRVPESTQNIFSIITHFIKPSVKLKYWALVLEGKTFPALKIIHRLDSIIKRPINHKI